MLIIPPPIRKQRRSAKRQVAQLVMVSAQFRVGGGGSITIWFDRPIDISAINPAAIVVAEGVTTFTLYGGASAILWSASSVKVNMMSLGSVPAGAQVLNATAGSGIVAVNDGGTWAGVGNVVLPFVG